MPHNLVNEGNQTLTKVKVVFPGKCRNGFLFINLPSHRKGKGRRDSALTLHPAGFSQEVALRCSTRFTYQNPIYSSKPVSAVVCPMSRGNGTARGMKKRGIARNSKGQWPEFGLQNDSNL